MKYSTFWVVTQRKVLLYWRFGTTFRSHLQGLRRLDRWRWDCYVVPKRRYQTTLRCVTTQKTEHFNQCIVYLRSVNLRSVHIVYLLSVYLRSVHIVYLRSVHIVYLRSVHIVYLRSVHIVYLRSVHIVYLRSVHIVERRTDLFAR